MDLQIIKAGLKKYPENQVADYCAYLTGLLTQKKKDKGNWVIANPWMGKKTDDYLIRMFKVVASDGLIFDGDNITLLATGISYNYHAYRNKMLLAYPESVIDVNLVHGEDVIKFSKNSGKVEYSHDIADPFNRTEKNLTGGYCVIKNKRGEFLTLLSKGDIDKHRKVSKMDYIWASWFLEMAQKTLIKKACKQHFLDIYSNIETMDNENYDLDSPLDIEIKDKQKIEQIKTIEKLKEYYQDNKDSQENLEAFNKMVTTRKEELTKQGDEL